MGKKTTWLQRTIIGIANGLDYPIQIDGEVKIVGPQ